VPRLKVACTVSEGGEGSDRIDKVEIVAGPAIEVFLGELQPKASREPTRAMAVAIDSLRISLVPIRIENRGRQFGIVRPGPSIDVVRSN
jgi:hypothetical protein